MTRQLRPHRQGRRRHYVMVAPTHFTVDATLNPWMDPTVPVDRARACEQWAALVSVYRRLGHTVTELPGVAGLPDMVFAANGALVLDGRALVARFACPERRPEASHFRRLLGACLGIETFDSIDMFEAEGDLVVAGDVILAGTGFRTAASSHGQVATVFAREVVTLDLVDPRFYHLDVAMAALDDHTIAWYPDALSADARREVQRRFPAAIEVDQQDAAVLGANLVSDGRHVVLDERATGLAAAVEDAGFTAVPVAVDEFNKSGGGVKCLTMELHPACTVSVSRDRHGLPGARRHTTASQSHDMVPARTRGAVA